MNNILKKLVIFIFAIVALGAINAYVMNGPLLQQTAQRSVTQLTSFNSAPPGDFQLGDLWISFSTVYIVEVVFIAVLWADLFLPFTLMLLFGKK